jgi:hydroxymethylpyrimidine kinase/phosphomethylpyrimidine kinase/thiamine-phosphate diphosphorylase
VQLRLKRAADEDEAAWRARLAGDVALATAAARASGGTLVLNDHLAIALERGIDFVHLGQEDLDALDAGARERLDEARSRGLRLGISSHSPWELARARGWAPDYVACGPVWPTTTKAMPWRPQGLENLRWWVSVAGAPVVAIGGLTTFERLAAAARCGAAAGAMARALAGATRAEVAAWRQAWESGRPDATGPAAQAVSRS